MDHSRIHIVSRTGTFPLGLAVKLIAKYAPSPNMVIFDPFCGRGTTLLAARLLGHKGFGIDIAPEAVIASRALLADIDFTNLEVFLETLHTEPSGGRVIPIGLRPFFHPRTLKDAIEVSEALRGALTAVDPDERDLAEFSLACFLGILHGHASYSLSVKSSHAFAMAPNYVRRYAREHGLVRPIRDIRQCILEKARYVLRDPVPDFCGGEVLRGAAKDTVELIPDLRCNVDVVMTSPPYLSAQTYAKDNWVRQWFLGYNTKALAKEYLHTGSVLLYRQLIRESFSAVVKCLKPNGVLIVVAGDVTTKGAPNRSKLRTASIIAEECETLAVPLKRIFGRVDVIDSHSRYLHSISKASGHSNDAIRERIVVLQRT